jgi:Zn-dependent peptidase ImmA (M78 family)
VAPRHTRAEQEAGRVLEEARAEFAALEVSWDSYRVDVDLLATLLFGLGIQQVTDLRVGEREYAGFLDAGARLVAVDANHHQHRQRFSVAHEIGHFVLHYLPAPKSGALFACTSTDMEVSTAPPGESARLQHLRQEWEANLFAGALLMPESAVRAMYKVTGGRAAGMARHFSVSPKAMEIRLDQLGLPYTPVNR